MPSNPAEYRPKRRSDLQLREGGGFTDVVDQSGKVLYRLNDTARALWEVCDGQTTLEEVFLAALQLFDVPEERLRADLRAAMDEFSRQGLLEGTG